MKQAQTSQIQGRTILKWWFLAMLIALSDAGVVGVLRLYTWVLDQGAWLWVLGWFGAVLALALARYAFNSLKMKSLMPWVARNLWHWEQKELREQLHGVNGGPQQSIWSEELWQQRRQRKRAMLVREIDQRIVLLNLAVLLGLLFCIQFVLAVLTIGLAFLVLGRSPRSVRPLKLPEFEGDVGQHWWHLQSRAWPQPLQKKALQIWSSLRKVEEKDWCAWEIWQQRSRLKAETRAQILTAVLLSLAALSVNFHWMAWRDLLAFGMTLVLAYAPMKQALTLYWEAKADERWMAQDQERLGPSRQGLIVYPIGDGLRWCDLGMDYGSLRPLWSGLNGCLSMGESLWVRGASGVGKSSFLRVLAGLQNASQGEVEIPEGGMVYMDQDLPLPLWIPNWIEEHGSQEQWNDWLARLGLTEILSQINSGLLSLQHLSGGERQRLILAILLVQKERLVVLDEPVASQTQSQRAELLSQIRQWCASKQKILVVASHDRPKDEDQWQILEL